MQTTTKTTPEAIQPDDQTIINQAQNTINTTSRRTRKINDNDVDDEIKPDPIPAISIAPPINTPTTETPLSTTHNNVPVVDTPTATIDDTSSHTLAEIQTMRERFRENIYRRYNLPNDDLLNNVENVVIQLEPQTLILEAAITNAATIVQQSLEGVGVKVEHSNKMAVEFKGDVGKFNSFVKSLKDKPYRNMLCISAGTLLFLYCTYKMGILRKVPAVVGGIMDLVSTSTPEALPSGGGNEAAKRTIEAIAKGDSDTMFDILKTPIAPIYTIRIAATGLAGGYLFLKGLRLILKVVKKVK